MSDERDIAADLAFVEARVAETLEAISTNIAAAYRLQARGHDTTHVSDHIGRLQRELAEWQSALASLKRRAGA